MPMTTLPASTPTKRVAAEDVRPGDRTAAAMPDGTWRVMDVLDVEQHGDRFVLSFSRTRQSVSIVAAGAMVRIVARGRYGVTNASTWGFATEVDDLDRAIECARRISGQVHDLVTGEVYGWVNGSWREPSVVG